MSLWILRVAVGTMSNVDLPLNDLLSAVAHATGAELVDGVATEVSNAVRDDPVPVFGEGATDSQIQGFKTLRGKAYEALCEFMPKVESPHSRCRSCCLPFCGRSTTFLNWRDYMIQAENPNTRGGGAWVLRTNKEAYLRQQTGEHLPTKQKLVQDTR